ncbi:MAG TPA: energy transducer TonB [Pyrinomonadaceae bacterium]|nr:energy transducer TonB [Pyrinomonadaceae bacterium]
MTFRRLLLIFICLLTFDFTVRAQNAPDDGWLRVQTDNGEFSIEVPVEYSYFFDPEGFIVGDNRTDYPVRDMNLLNAYRDQTLVSVETYRAGGNAMNGLLNAAIERGVRTKKSKLNGIDVREVVRVADKDSSTGEFYFVSRYFRSREFVYVISSLSRGGETPTMTRFFGSLKFDPQVEKPLASVKRFTELTGARVDVKDSVATYDADHGGNAGDKGPVPSSTPVSSDSSDRKVTVASKPRASYVNKARDNNIRGAVRLRMVLSEKGHIPLIEVQKTLPDGLARQAIFAALRLKFLPAEKGGKPVPVRKTLEYTFEIY